MSFESFTSPLPIDYFADGRKITGRGKGPVQDRRDSLVDLLNDLRANSVFRGYQVDPDDPDKFNTVNEAYAAADLQLPFGFPILIDIASTKDHVLDSGVLAVNGTRSLFISVSIDETPKADKSWKTKITGDITLSAADSASDRLTLGLKGFILDGDINGNSNWEINLNSLHMDTNKVINRIHGTNGCNVFGVGFHCSSFSMIDADVGTGTVQFYESTLSLGFESNIAFKFLGGVAVTLRNCIVDCFSTSNNTLFDFNGAGGGLTLLNTCIFPFVFVDTILKLGDNSGAASITWSCPKIQVSSDGKFDCGAWTSVTGFVEITANKEPLNPSVGFTWVDTELNDILLWDGTYWGNGSIFRKDLLVDVDTAAVSHSSGWAVPANAGVISTSSNALKDLTSGGGATLYGISDGSDGDKFAESSALVQNSKASAKQASINVGAGDTIYVHSMTSTGTEGGTLAGSNDEDVKVVVYFTMPKTLPSV